MRDADIIKNITDVAELKATLIDSYVNMGHELLLIRTRVDALEKVLFGSRFSLLTAAIVGIFSPSSMARVIQKIHVAEIKRFNAEMQKEKAGLVKPEGGLCVR